VNPYHDPINGQFTTAGQAGSPTPTARHKPPEEMTPAEARTFLEARKPKDDDPGFFRNAIKALRGDYDRKPTEPRTSGQHSQRHRDRIAAGEDPRDDDAPAPLKPAKRVTPLKPAEIEAMRAGDPRKIVTDDDADRRDLGLSPHPRSAGPHLITAPGAAQLPGIHLGGGNADQLHSRMVYHLTTRVVAEADRKGTNHIGSPAVPETPDATRPGLSPGFGRAPTPAQRPYREPLPERRRFEHTPMKSERRK
jgi:hypothetical protein